MRWLVGLVIAGGAAGALWFFIIEKDVFPAGAAPAASTGGPAPIAVETAGVSRGAVKREIEAVGTLRSNESVMIRPEIAGRVSEIQVEEGAQVSKGKPLVRLDSAIARAQLEQARASLILARSNHERANELYRKGAGTQRAFEETVFKLRADEAAVALAQAILEKSTITAPFDGILGLRRISVGDYVTPGQDFVNIESIETLKVDFRVPEIYSGLLAAGQTIRVSVDAFPGVAHEGKVYAIDPAVDPNGRAVILRARLPNREGKLRSGMFARVVLTLEERKNAILIPETALVPVGTDHYLFRVADGKAVWTKVKIGQRERGSVEVLEGLAPDAVIVTEGALKLKDGSRVRVVSAKVS